MDADKTVSMMACICVPSLSSMGFRNIVRAQEALCDYRLGKELAVGPTAAHGLHTDNNR